MQERLQPRIAPPRKRTSNQQAPPEVTAPEILIIGKLALTFGVLLGLPLIDLWLLARRRRAADRDR